jgi:hypothetical protein
VILHAWSVFCSDSSIDKDTNNISLFSVLEELKVVTPLEPPRDAALPLRGHVVSLWYRAGTNEPEAAEARYILKAGGSEVAILGSYTLDLTRPRLRTRVVIQALPIWQSAFYQIAVEYRHTDEDWILATELPLEVTVSIESQATD